MQFGVHFHSHGAFADPRLLVDLAREAEAAGWDGVFICDRLPLAMRRSPRRSSTRGSRWRRSPRRPSACASGRW